MQVGTPQYICPEYLRTGKYSLQSDVYALGMVMLGLLSGIDKGAVVPLVEKACTSFIERGDRASIQQVGRTCMHLLRHVNW